MRLADTQSLLADYADHGSEASFRELVSRYSHLVYGTALRRVNGDEHLAQDVTQTVFIDLARLARGLGKGGLLGGWLHRHACYVAANMMRGEQRRKLREREAVMNEPVQASPSGVDHLRLYLDEAIDRLGEADRAAILLRFFEGQDLRSIGNYLGTNEDAAQKRVDRAVAKLQRLLKNREVVLPAGSLAVLLAAEAASAAPAAWVTGLAGSALAGAAAKSGTFVTLIQLITMTKANLAIATVVLAALVSIPWSVYHRSQAGLREENRALKAQFVRLEKNKNPLDALVFAGFATPEAAAQSLIWAMHQGDLSKLQECMTPEAWDKMNQEFEDKPEAEVVKMLQEGARDAKIPPTREKVYPDGRVTLALISKESTNGQMRMKDQALMTFQQIGGEWKATDAP